MSKIEIASNRFLLIDFDVCIECPRSKSHRLVRILVVDIDAIYRISKSRYLIFGYRYRHVYQISKVGVAWIFFFLVIDIDMDVSNIEIAKDPLTTDMVRIELDYRSISNTRLDEYICVGCYVSTDRLHIGVESTSLAQVAPYLVVQRIDQYAHMVSHI